jgi:UDP-glucose 4-epimerase
MKRTALVTGAGGAIGSTLVRRLLEQNYAVRALVRESPMRSAGIPESVEIVCGDITDCQLIRRAVQGTDVIFHLAAKLHVNNPSSDLKNEYVRVNVEGTRCLARAAQEAGAGRLVFFSTINVYGPTQPGQILDDDSPLHPDSLYAETKAQAEEIVRDIGASVVLRVAAVYGPRMKGNFPRLLHALRKRRLALIGNGSNRRTLVYIEDLCRAAILTAEHGAAKGQTYNVTDGSIHTLREIIDAMSDALGQPPPRLHLPKSTVRFAAAVLEDSFTLIGKSSPIGRSTVDKLTEDVAVSGTKIQYQLGYQPQYDLRAGWRETISLTKP